MEKQNKSLMRLMEPGGCALIIETLTENKNKAAQEIKHILTKNGFELAAPGSATWAFDKNIPKNTISISEEDGQKLGVLIEELEENDEVQEFLQMPNKNVLRDKY